jgi:HEAT repeat protein
MGFFDFLFGGNKETQLKRHAKKVSNLNAQADEREASAEWLAEEGSPQAIAALLKRFSLNYEQRMKDTQEKEIIYRLIERMGDDVIEPAKEWMRRNPNFAHPLKLVTKYEGEEATIHFLLELLTLENDDFSPQKKLQLLSHLQNHKHEAICSSVIPYLKDFNEDVRFATIEAIAVQKDPLAREPLLSQMGQEASNRLRHRIATIFAEESWSVSPHEDLVQEKIPVGFTLQGDQLIEE